MDKPMLFIAPDSTLDVLSSLLNKDNKAVLVKRFNEQVPHYEMLGVDLVLPDISYLQDKKSQIKAILLTLATRPHWWNIASAR